MAIYTTHQLRDWLGEMRRFASRDADRATALLNELDEAERAVQIEDNVRALLVEAGLLDKGDYMTDPVPLLRMFLPV